MLEGNIETTGASCHIRTSYLPQEILFGFRFIPNHPKISNSEYLFDYSKFDQVEPVNLHLIPLTMSHLNPQLNLIWDAKNELKNHQITYHNTGLKKPTSIENTSDGVTSLRSLFNNPDFQRQGSSRSHSENESKQNKQEKGNRFTLARVEK